MLDIKLCESKCNHCSDFTLNEASASSEAQTSPKTQTKYWPQLVGVEKQRENVYLR